MSEKTRIERYAEALRNRRRARCAECTAEDVWQDCSMCDAIAAMAVAGAELAEARAALARIEALVTPWSSLSDQWGTKAASEAARSVVETCISDLRGALTPQDVEAAR